MECAKCGSHHVSYTYDFKCHACGAVEGSAADTNQQHDLLSKELRAIQRDALDGDEAVVIDGDDWKNIINAVEALERKARS